MEPSLSFEPPNTKLFLRYSSFTHPKSSHTKLIETHWFNHKISMFLSLQDKHKDKTKEDILSPFSASLPPYLFFYLVRTSLHHLLKAEFLNEYVGKGGLFVLSQTSIESGNVACILPNGHLIFNIDDETYKQLGLEGSHARFPLKNGDRHVIDIDMKSKRFVPGEKLYDRVLWCLNERVSPGTFYITHIGDEGNITEIDFQRIFSAKELGSIESIQKIAMNRKVDFFRDIPIPDITSFVSKSKMPDKQQTEDDIQTFSADFYEWSGFLHCGLLEKLCKKNDEFLSSFELSPDLLCTPKSGFMVSYEGLIPPSVVNVVVDTLRVFVSKRDFDWGLLTVWGFDDAPLSWGTCEHGFLQSGENNYTFVVLPNDQYCFFSAGGNYDSFS
eukprot:TRINITY_DN3319_c0_g1_i1.p1 TRINITY_DN3319_c0_g1~~TRINITY_DN3319_c0_g1_i1.p1  ORF type:complete len:385 (-),score=66.01 TRINITY_DN3319_c0_g1_i1:87-1241(-)